MSRSGRCDVRSPRVCLRAQEAGENRWKRRHSRRERRGRRARVQAHVWPLLMEHSHSGFRAQPRTSGTARSTRRAGFRDRFHLDRIQPRPGEDADDETRSQYEPGGCVLGPSGFETGPALRKCPVQARLLGVRPTGGAGIRRRRLGGRKLHEELGVRAIGGWRRVLRGGHVRVQLPPRRGSE